MKLKMIFHFILILIFVINIIFFGEVHGRPLAQRPLLAHMTQKGQIYDCVDYYKQPAFDHPLLKNHIPKVRPNLTTSFQGKFVGFQGSCPDGTVPILRQFEDPPPKTIPAKAHCHAVVRTNKKKKFYGTSALPSLNKPKVQVNQWSAARLKLSNGPDSIEAGWMVYPTFFKDDEAHLYAKYKAGSTECLNTYCPGFVQEAKDLPLGTVPDTYSIISGEQHMWNISINKHQDDGNWWLSMTWPDSGTRQIGYWPKSLFTMLEDSATQVEWGGEIDDPGAVEPAPSMGSGLKAEYHQEESAFFQQITVVDESFNNVQPDGTEKYYDCPDLYTVLDWGDAGDDHGRLISYGGFYPLP
ncbi:hypothetical protein RND81_09G258000 [Saponaria officinalis]|uniref:Neprosin PEP catalytic domain-containing protein n=1 Tax=Saponaria officinalis TaxID=3572 RepID=A0AAW1IRF5_SAPOF